MQQPYTDPYVLALGLFGWLMIFLGAAWGVNSVLKRSVLNGALFFLLFEGMLLVNDLDTAARSQLGAKGVGAIVGGFLLPALLGAYLARRFEKRKKAQKA